MEEEQEEQEQTPQIDPEIESRATLYGWVPKEQFRGDPERWTPADQFVQRADEMLPIARSMNRKLEGDIGTLKQENARLTKTMGKIIDVNKKVSETAYKRAREEITAEQAKAITDGDAEKWTDLETKKDNLEKPEEIKVEEAPAGTVDPPEVSAWKDENPWYNDDPEMGNYADVASDFITKRNPGLPVDQFLSKVKDEVKKKFPGKFTNPNRNKAGVNDGGDFGGGGDPGGGNGKTYNDLPPEAKTACASLIKQKMITQKQYVEDYFSEE